MPDFLNKPINNEIAPQLFYHRTRNSGTTLIDSKANNQYSPLNASSILHHISGRRAFIARRDGAAADCWNMVNCFNHIFSSGLVFSSERRDVLKNISAMSSGFLDSDEELDNDDFHQATKLGEPYEVSKSSSEPKSKEERTKPKRPLSAYNWFFQTERQRILDETPTRKEGKPRRSHGKIGFADLARMIAAKWKSLSKEERQSYDEKAAIDKQRYQREMEEWKEGQSAAVSQAVSSSAAAFRNPMSFMNDPVRTDFSRQPGAHLFGTAYSPVPPPERQLADEMKMPNTGSDILPMEPYSLTDVFGAELTRRRQEAAPAPALPTQPPPRPLPNMDNLASQLGDESTQLFLNLFRER